MKTAAVIGSGFGGLALAIRLQSAGVQTTLFEARDKPGGRAYVYEDAGFTFDAGPTIITDPSSIEELFALSGRKLSDYVELMPISPFYRLCWEDGYSFDYVNDQAALDRQIGAKSPPDVAGYQRFLAYSKELLQEGYLKLGSVPFRTSSCARPSASTRCSWAAIPSPPRPSTP
jgi:phytoene desaturase